MKQIIILSLFAVTACHKPVEEPKTRPAKDSTFRYVIWDSALAKQKAVAFRNIWKQCVEAQKALRDQGLYMDFQSPPQTWYMSNEKGGRTFTPEVNGCDPSVTISFSAQLHLKEDGSPELEKDDAK